MNTPDCLSESEFDRTLHQVFSEWEAGLSAPRALRSRVLVTAALHNDRARPEQTRARRRTSRPAAYKDIDHRMTNNVMLYASPLGFGMLNLRA
jgi:hypothetical protein